MTISNNSKLIPVVVIVSVLVVSIIATVFTQAQVDRAKEEVIESKDAKTAAVSSRTELRLQDVIKILELASKQDSVRNVQYAESVSEEFMGIPADADLEKRQAAKDLLDVYEDFDTVAFVLPNGDIYLIEPYTAQQNLPRLNFAFREWYQGVISTKDAYIGQVVVSAATGHIIVPVAVPVWSVNGSSLTGIMVAAMDLNIVQEKLAESDLGINEYIIIVDHQANIVADSREGQSLELRSAAYLQNIKNVLVDAEKGSSIEIINGTKMFAYYHPISLISHKWALVSLQPYDDAFSVLNTISYQSVITITSMVLVSAISGYFLHRAFKSNSTLTNRLEKVNDELKSQAEKLKEVDKEKEEFSAMITHELKTPLVPIIGYSELLLDGTLGNLTQKQKEKIQVMYESGVSLSRLISDLLDVRKLELGQMKFDIVDAPARNIVEKSIDSLRPLAQSKAVTLTYRSAEGDGNEELKIKCDPKRIQQVMNNLLTNAIKFVPENIGKIEVSTKMNVEDRSVLFSVKDNGFGIPKDKQQNLFKKFYQADTSLSRNAGGTGLGLAICKGIVKAHKGKIWFESESGAGSSFYFTIPLSDKSELIGAGQ